MRTLYCWLIGHRFIIQEKYKVGTILVEYRYHFCSRCGKIIEVAFEHPVINVTYKQ